MFDTNISTIQIYWNNYVWQDVLREPHKNPSISVHSVICVVTWGTELCESARNESQNFLTHAYISPTSADAQIIAWQKLTYA